MRSYTSLGIHEAELTRTSRAAVIAVADVHGELVTLVRLDGAPPASILIAANKAWTAARERRPTREIGQSARDPESGFDMAYYGDPRYVGWGGGVPVVVDGAVVGAVAVSGSLKRMTPSNVRSRSSRDASDRAIGVAAIAAGSAPTRS